MFNLNNGASGQSNYFEGGSGNVQFGIFDFGKPEMRIERKFVECAGITIIRTQNKIARI